MRTVRWTLAAQSQRLEWLIALAEWDDQTALRAFEASVAATDQLAQHPFAYRRSRWPGLHERSLTHWNKIAVYQVTDTEVIIVAFYDARQDLTAVSPKSEID